LPVTFRRGDAEAPPAEGAPYDVILERHVIWTLPQPREAVQAWRALLKPGGLLILAVTAYLVRGSLSSARPERV
jgi:2-polyprenyl-3-methyl-5-hydroxy-6-metoxy-1,4-benzoquinol methylase